MLEKSLAKTKAAEYSPAPMPDLLAGVRARFCATIIDRVLSFESLRKNISSSDNPSQEAQGISALAHKIAGVAGTLGYQHIGNLSADLERKLTEGARSGVPISETWKTAEPVLEELLDELESLLDT